MRSVGAVVISSRHAETAGREDPRRKEITTALTPREGTTDKIDIWAVNGPSNVRKH
jgi:hypothetical protein